MLGSAAAAAAGALQRQNALSAVLEGTVVNGGSTAFNLKNRNVI